MLTSRRACIKDVESFVSLWGLGAIRPARTLVEDSPHEDGTYWGSGRDFAADPVNA